MPHIPDTPIPVFGSLFSAVVWSLNSLNGTFVCNVCMQSADRFDDIANSICRSRAGILKFEF